MDGPPWRWGPRGGPSPTVSLEQRPEGGKGGVLWSLPCQGQLSPANVRGVRHRWASPVEAAKRARISYGVLCPYSASHHHPCHTLSLTGASGRHSGRGPCGAISLCPSADEEPEPRPVLRPAHHVSLPRPKPSPVGPAEAPRNPARGAHGALPARGAFPVQRPSPPASWPGSLTRGRVFTDVASLSWLRPRPQNEASPESD